MSSASSGQTTRDEEMDTILRFAEESSSRDLFSKETELTQTWLSGASRNDSSRERDGDESCERSNVAHISVDINDPATKRLDLECGSVKKQDRDEPKPVNDVEASQEGNGSNGLKRLESSASVVTAKCSTTSTSTNESLTTVDSKNIEARLERSTSFSSTDEHECSSTVSGKAAGTSTSCEEVAGDCMNGPVVAKVGRLRTSTSCEEVAGDSINGPVVEKVGRLRTSISCEEVAGDSINGPVVAKVGRLRDGRSSSCRTCFYFCELPGIMKVIEIIAMLLALIITVGVDGASYYSDSLIIVNGVMLMGLTVTPTLLVCYLLKQTQIQRTFFECIINGFLALYCVVAGCSALGALLTGDSNVPVSVTLGLLLLTAGVAYAVDCVLAILKYRT